MTFVDLFAGIGGFRRGMELAGHKCVGFCEWDKFATDSYTSMHLITEKQREYLSTLSLKERQKEILKEEYRNGEWYSNDIRNVDAGSIPRCDCWCFGSPCQDFSIAGKRAGLEGDRSSLIREVFRILGEIEEEDRPEWLIYENVKGMLSSNGGADYLAILMEMDNLGYDAEWEDFNTSWFLPQNRERIYTLGHFRRFGSAKVFPITPTNGEDCVPIEIIGHRDGYRRNTQVFSPDGITETLSTCQSGGREHHTVVPIGFINAKDDGTCRTIKAQCYKNSGANYIRRDSLGASAVAVAVGVDVESSEDHPGMYVEMEDGCIVWAVWYEKYQCYIAIRKLTPRESFRLQGWSDDYFEKAEFVNSDSQLYKQAGNGVSVPVAEAIGKAISMKVQNNLQ